jgi:H/ACA ribonucleoprotein complex subunit 4
MACGVGGHMKELRRTRSGPFREEQAVTLHNLHDAAYYYFEQHNKEYLEKIIQPIENAMVHIPWVVIRDTAVDAICRGAALTAPGIVKVSSRISNGKLVVIKTLKGEAVALGTALSNTKDILELSHGKVIKTERVLMEAGTYPSSWKS